MSAGLPISVFIPAYNAQATLAAVIDRIDTALWEQILSLWIIDDGSTDETVAVCRMLIQEHPQIRLLELGSNKGYGVAVKSGLEKCRGEQCSVAVCLHSDGQYPPESIGAFVATVVEKKVDVLQGSRIASGTALSGGMPFYKYVANRVLTFFENRVFSLALTDYHSGFLFYSRKALDCLPFEKMSASFDFDLEAIVRARVLGLNIAELPIPTRYAGEVSYLNPITYGLRVVGVMMRFLAGRFRP